LQKIINEVGKRNAKRNNELYVNQICWFSNENIAVRSRINNWFVDGSAAAVFTSVKNGRMLTRRRSDMNKMSRNILTLLSLLS